MVRHAALPISLAIRVPPDRLTIARHHRFGNKGGVIPRHARPNVIEEDGRRSVAAPAVNECFPCRDALAERSRWEW